MSKKVTSAQTQTDTPSRNTRYNVAFPPCTEHPTCMNHRATARQRHSESVKEHASLEPENVVLLCLQSLRNPGIRGRGGRLHHTVVRQESPVRGQHHQRRQACASCHQCGSGAANGLERTNNGRHGPTRAVVIFCAGGTGRRRICVRPRCTHAVGGRQRPYGLRGGQRGASLHLRLWPCTAAQRMTVVCNGALDTPQSARILQRHAVLREGQCQNLGIVGSKIPIVARAVV